MLGEKVLKLAEEFIVNNLKKNKIIVYIYNNHNKIKEYYERLGYKNINEYVYIIGIKLCVYQKEFFN
jgi:histone acetyltransferase (RNA polymerase elongator complex component)